jgi:hypothetical protein
MHELLKRLDALVARADRLLEIMEKDREFQHTHRNKNEAEREAAKKVGRLLIDDKRFSGLRDKAIKLNYVAEHVMIAVANAEDPVLVLNHLVAHPKLAERLWILEPEETEREVKAIEQRAKLGVAATSQ